MRRRRASDTTWPWLIRSLLEESRERAYRLQQSHAVLRSLALVE